MVSEADPYLWASLASMFLGLALGQGAKSLLRGRESPAARTSRRPRRMARATTFLALFILAIAGLLVFALRPGAAGAGSAMDTVFFSWAGAIAILAALVGLRPLVLGAPIAFLFAAALVVIGMAVKGWLPLPAANRSGASQIARLLPYEVGAASFRGQLELASTTSEASLASNSVGLCSESLELSGPLGFLARLLLPPAYSASLPSTPRLTLYRVVGLVANGGLMQDVPAPPRLDLLDRFAPLPSDVGFDPGGTPESRSSIFRLLSRMRATSPVAPLQALEQVLFGLDRAGRVSIIN